MRNTQQGFTLIELVVVIVILGILAAIAVPRFVSMQGDARFSVLQGVAASVQSTSAMVHAKALAANITNGNLPAGSIEGIAGAVAVVNQYPDSASINTLLNLQPAGNFDIATAGTIKIAGAAVPGSCQVTYANATIAGTVVTPPVINTNGSAVNCN